MKIFGHPVHIMLIHFPAALFPMELVCYFIFYQTAKASFAYASYYAMVGGVALGCFAIVTGMIDMLKIKTGSGAVKLIALVHGSINTTAVVGYGIIAYSSYLKYPALPVATQLNLIIKLLLNILMIAGNYLGGSLILKHKVAIEN